MMFQIKNRWTGNVQFECELDAEYDTLTHSLQLGTSVKIAVIKRADLRDADLQGKAIQNKIIAKLEVPADAKRTASVIGRKCRAEFVRVLELSDGHTEGRDQHTGMTLYRVGEIVRPDSYNDDPLVECTNGIHFFLTREEAEEWK